MVEISIVIPVYNSEDCLAELIKQIHSAMKDFQTFEVILVNDQSRDQSWNKIKELSQEYFFVKGIDLRKNSGQDNALLAGFRASGGNYIVIMDDDLQHSPADIRLLHQECVKGDWDVVYANFESKKQAWWKNFGSWLNGKMAEWFISKPSGIYLSPYKIIRKDVIEEVLKYSGSYPYIDGLIFSVTSRIGQIETKHYERFKGKSNYNLIRSIAVFLKLVTGFSVIPLRISSYIGFVTAIAGFLLGIFYISQYFLSKQTVEGWTTLVVINLFVGGLILFAIGIAGEYIGRTYMTISNRPQYSIREVAQSVKKSGEDHNDKA